jgi:hypothetical protein
VQEIVESRTDVLVIYTWDSGTAFPMRKYITASISLVQMSQCISSTSTEGSIADVRIMHEFSATASLYKTQTISPLTCLFHQFLHNPTRTHTTQSISAFSLPLTLSPILTHTVPSAVPLTVIKGAGHEHIPIPAGESAIVADFHSIQTQTKDNPTYLTSGFYRIQPGPTRDIPAYTYEETKYVLQGQIDVLDEATGVTHQ